MSYTYEYPRPAVTADVVAFAAADAGPRILLIRRAREPYAGKWALPGGFIEIDEELEAAARRELAEETGLEVGALAEVGTFGRVRRDPRGRTISVAWAAVFVGAPPATHAADDAAEARWHALRKLPPLAFDHREIVARAKVVLAGRARHGDGLTGLLPARFTLAELVRVQGMVLDERPDARSLGARLRRAGVIRPTAERRGRETVYSRSRAR